MSGRSPTSWSSIAAVAVTVALVLPIAAHAYLGTFSRYFADDYCSTAVVSGLGLWGASVQYYLTWTGRYSLVFAVTLAETLGPWVARVLPGLALGGWLAALIWLLLPLQRRREMPFGPHFALMLAALVLFGTLAGLSDPFETIYWQSGLLSHLAPLPFLTLLLGMIVRPLPPTPRWRRVGGPLLAAVTAVVAGGFSEMATTLQLTLMGGAIAQALRPSHRTHRSDTLPVIFGAAGGTLLAAVVMVLAPGNRIRLALQPGALRGSGILQRSYSFTLQFLHQNLENRPAEIAALAAVPILWVVCCNRAEEVAANGRVETDRWKNLAWMLLLLPPLGFAALQGCFVSPAYALPTFPPDRALVIPSFVLACLLATWGCVAACACSSTLRGPRVVMIMVRGLAGGMMIILLAVGPIGSARDIRSQRKSLRAVAAAWDERDRLIRSAAAEGARTLYVSALRFPNGPQELGPDPEEWVNRCLANYYGLGAVVGEPAVLRGAVVTPVLASTPPPGAHGILSPAGPETLLSGNRDRNPTATPLPVRFGGADAGETAPTMHPTGQGTIQGELLDGLRTGTGDPTWECLRWKSASPYKEIRGSVTLDLGQAATLKRVEVWTVSPFGDYRVDRLDILVSEDGAGFRPVGFALNRNPRGKSAPAFPMEVRTGGVRARYVRLVVVQFGGSGTTMPLCEVYLYGYRDAGPAVPRSAG